MFEKLFAKKNVYKIDKLSPNADEREVLNAIRVDLFGFIYNFNSLMHISAFDPNRTTNDCIFTLKADYLLSVNSGKKPNSEAKKQYAFAEEISEYIEKHKDIFEKYPLADVKARDLMSEFDPRKSFEEIFSAYTK